MSPHQFVIRCRIERAKELLLQGKLTIADVACRVGFNDQSHMHRYFKRCSGMLLKLAIALLMSIFAPQTAQDDCFRFCPIA
ncbi:MAG: helix-turn-helix transcriptional regulator [Hydrococcus sp. Prado102]|nr:helix-turn-helix transcriptional regulator [Hydrococcus sp. Prado102]